MARKPPVFAPQQSPVVASPPTQEEMSYLQWLEGKGQRIETIDPLSDEGLRLQALYVQNFSQHPMDVIRRVMENPFTDPKDRLSAAKTLMEYSLRKPAANMEVKATGSVLSIDPTRLAKLSSEDLEALQQLLEKANT